MNKEFATTDELTANYWSQHLRSPGLRMMGHMGYDFRRGLGRYSQGMTYPFRHDRGRNPRQRNGKPDRRGLGYANETDVMRDRYGRTWQRRYCQQLVDDDGQRIGGATCKNDHRYFYRFDWPSSDSWQYNAPITSGPDFESLHIDVPSFYISTPGDDPELKCYWFVPLTPQLHKGTLVINLDDYIRYSQISI